MREHELWIQIPNGVMATFLALPDTCGPYPPVVLFRDV
jgi:hypothetical protein